MGNGKLLIQIKESFETVTARLHPRGEGVEIPTGALVYVSTSRMVDNACHDHEVLAYGIRGAPLVKLGCVHPDRLHSNSEELCANCPHKSVSD
jgi:hypothetical protein